MTPAGNRRRRPAARPGAALASLAGVRAGHPPGRQNRSYGVPLAAAAALALLLLALAATDALAGPSSQRTVRVRTGPEPNGASVAPRLSASGRFVAFDSVATNLGSSDPNGKVRDAFFFDQNTGSVLSLSSPADPAGANGPSFSPVLNAAGDTAAFVSRASNLVAGDTNGRADVYVRSAGGLERISLATDGAQPQADALDADLSADGRFVVFASAADNLVPADTNSASDVFVRDRAAQVTTAVSVAGDGAPANGRSSGPAISADGRFVAFTSTAKELVAGDTNRVADVFVRDLQAGTTTRVSLSNGGRQQSRAIAAPFRQVSDISSDGRYVVFDSDARNLVRGDDNRQTDVFVRDRRRRTTRRVSLATTGQQADSDSFAPAMTPDGRYVTFESFASNLTPNDPPRENVFVRDLVRRHTVMADVSSRGRPRGPERVRQLLQRPAIADDGATVAFVSTARNLVARDRNRAQDVFLRKLTPAPTAVASPRADVRSGRLIITFSSPNPQAGPLLCRLDRRPSAICPLGRALLPALRDGRHRLVAFPGGNGSWYAKRPVRVSITLRKGRARVRVENPLDSLR